MKIVRIDNLKELLVYEKEWTSLFASMQPHHPFLSFEWTVAWCRHQLQRKSFWVQLKPFILICYEQSQIVAIIPLFLTVWLPGLKGGIKYLHPIGSDPNLTEIKPLLRTAHTSMKAVLTACESYLARRKHEWHFLQWPHLEAQHLETRSFNPFFDDPVSAFVIELKTANWDEFRAQCKKNTKELIRRCTNKARRDQLNLNFLVCREPTKIKDHLADFFKLHQERALSPIGPRHPNYFKSLPAQQFVTELASSLKKPWMTLFILRDRDKTVAMRLGFETDHAFYLYYSGSLDAYRTYSVGNRMTIEILREALARGKRAIHLGTGLDQSKSCWNPVEICYHQPLVCSPNLFARVTFLVFLMARFFHRTWQKKRLFC
jgi:CelD/BcsL family acetyltransferase involved in cellulose biosynthesis